jgi:hypothetical protein
MRKSDGARLTSDAALLLLVGHPTAGSPRHGQWRLVAAYGESDRQIPGGGLAGSRERVVRPRMVVLYRARPALACIIGARRAWTVEMISSEEIPCR